MRRLTQARLLALLVLLLVPAPQATAYATCQEGYDYYDEHCTGFCATGCGCEMWGTPEQECHVWIRACDTGPGIQCDDLN